ncbi:UvrD-helicase domain-containing protein [Sphaerochaeta sp.]|jgi:hypothetical protein|uniref:UvrD-helicase domain-containing protein n=1 Tax=Sphaerochaeta sp. TaxID=1972642 RepID=UPI002A36071F|nr:UvrD-helicase domain-containing protein [Sphaerochaeta sp.]MDX9984845.1 UvrD-helicase domain-containing protein [Sphaerochaeta sp.]
MGIELISIRDVDIDEIEGNFQHRIVFDDERRNVLKCLESMDIQAFPGSGKTTTLVAKLAILAKKWPSVFQGICVLSHTNVARDEVEKRLGKTDVGHALLDYPHFIGTIHNFFNKYVCLPWLKSQGCQIQLIDTERVTHYRWYHLNRVTKIFLENGQQDHSICEFIDIDNNIKWPKGWTSEKKQGHKAKVVKVIEDSQKKGFFTHQEMLFLAFKILHDNRTIIENLRVRFPIVFLDEAQDTSKFQWKLINETFPPDKVIRQAFGDCNQAIFNNNSSEAELCGFPGINQLTISKSKRFGNAIAAIANTIAVSKDKMEGTETAFDQAKHTVFLFQRNPMSCYHVIEKYAQLILNSYTDDEINTYQDLGFRVVGMVNGKLDEDGKENSINENKFPKGICDYWNEYDPKWDSSVKNFNTMIQVVRSARNGFNETGDFLVLINRLLPGLLQLLAYSKAEIHTPIQSTFLSTVINMLPEKRQQNFRLSLLELCMMRSNTKSEWDRACKILIHIIQLFDGNTNEETNAFLAYCDHQGTAYDSTSKAASATPNCLVYGYNNRSIKLEFSSIHAVKGRTNFSTLVLDTFFHKRNFEELLIAMREIPSKSKIIDKRMRVHYVAMTRPKALLCLAMPEDIVKQGDRDFLMNLGFDIQKVE